MSGRSYLRQLLRNPPLIVWCLFILMTPFYVVHGGLPQPADGMILILVPVTLSSWNGQLNRKSTRVFRALLWFTVWVIVVDLAWAVILGKFDINLFFPVYYIFNLVLFLTALILYQRYGDTFLRLTVQLVFIALIIQVAISFISRRSVHRNELFFSNPNQLGYYALLAGCIIALTQRRVGLGLLKSSLGLTACGYLAVLSASRAAAAGVAFLLVLVVFSNPRVIVLATTVALALIFAGGPLTNSIDALQARVAANRNPERNFFENRGYDRIWSNREYLISGAGEGNTTRFAQSTAFGDGEIHSSAAGVLFSYGIIGVVLFLIFMWRLVRGAPLRTALILIPPLMYTVAHQGLRFTSLWVLLAIFVGLKETPAVLAIARKPAPGPRPASSLAVPV